MDFRACRTYWWRSNKPSADSSRIPNNCPFLEEVINKSVLYTESNYYMNIFVRILIAVIACIAILALVGPVLRLIGFPVSSDLLLVVRVVVSISALLYVLAGTNLWPRSN